MELSELFIFAAIIMQLVAMVQLFVDLFRFFKLSAEEKTAYHYDKKRKKRVLVLFILGYILLFISGVLDKQIDGFGLWGGMLAGFERCVLIFVMFKHYFAFCLFGFLLYFDHRAKKTNG